MPSKVVETTYPLIDNDPHASRVVRYFRASDYATWGLFTAGVPAFLRFWEHVDPSTIVRYTANRPTPVRTYYGLGAFVGFTGGFLVAYQNSSLRFWGWTENAREAQRDLEELSALAAAGKPLYGESHQPAWIQEVAHRTSAYSALKFAAIPVFNLVNHPHHGTDPAKYGVKPKQDGEIVRAGEGI